MFPFILKILVVSFEALEVIVTDLLIGPTLLESYFTLIVADSPGLTGVLG